VSNDLTELKQREEPPDSFYRTRESPVVRRNLSKSYAFFAPTGAGKTAFPTALFSAMLDRLYMSPHSQWNVFPVRHISAQALLDQHSRWVNGRHSEKLEPEVTSRKIAKATKAGQTYRLFIEDMNGEDSAAREGCPRLKRGKKDSRERFRLI
jgi:hypothetical protein